MPSIVVNRSSAPQSLAHSAGARPAAGMPPGSSQFAQPVPVPASTGPVLELVQMQAVSVDPRLGGPLMKALAVASPLTGLQHVKRVRKRIDSSPLALHILLCRVDWEQQQQQVEDDIEQKQQQLGKDGEAGGRQQTGSAAGEQPPSLPPAVAEIVRQHGLQPFTVQVRRCGAAPGALPSWCWCWQ